MSNTEFTKNIRIFCALTLRDVYTLYNRLYQTFIDALVVMSCTLFVFAGMLPALGLEPSLSFPIYIGNCVGFLFHLGNAKAHQLLFDLEGDRAIDFYLTLPIPLWLLLIQRIIGFVIEAALLMAPIIGGGILYFSLYYPVHINPILLLLSGALALTFFGTFFMMLGMWFSKEWYLSNAWPRMLSPMFTFGGTFFIYQSVYKFSPAFARLFFINPSTHAAEGLRAAIVGGPLFIPWYITTPVLMSAIMLAYTLLYTGARYRLDPL